MFHSYKTSGTCSVRIDLELRDDKVYNVKFYGGCPGNLSAIPILVQGMSVNEIEDKLKDVKCGMKNTSCAAQLAKAVRTAYDEETGV